MIRFKAWSYSEEKLLIKHYEDLTIKELEQLFPSRSRESINNKIKRLKKTGSIKDGKNNLVIQRAYEQRGKDIQ